MAPTGTRFEVEKFNGTGNFGLWQTQVKDLLAQQGCLKALRDAKPAKMDAKDWEELQLQAAGTIRLCLSDQVIYHVMDEDSPKKIWEKLESQYMSKTATTKVYLKQKLYGLKMQEGSDLVEYMNAFNQVRHVPGLRRNLISLGVLDDYGMEFRCDRDKKTSNIMKDEVTVMIGERTASHLFRLQGSTIAD